MKNVSTQKEHKTSPERYRVWTEPATLVKRMKRVSVVYYLSRNGHLEHPHFMEVPLSCPDGLYLKDVMRRLNLLRGKGMASSYSWSSKRSYKNGFVWHDLSEHDYIHPAHGLEYVLKGSEILDGCNSEEDSECGKSQQWSSGRLHESAAGEVDVSTQTKESEKQIVEVQGSPPLVDSSPETLESLMKADKKVMVLETNSTDTTNEEVLQSGRLKASSVLIQLITCGTFSFRTSVTTTTTNQHKGEESSEVEKNGVEDDEYDLSRSYEKLSLEDKEYLSGSLIEKKTNKMKDDDELDHQFNTVN